MHLCGESTADGQVGVGQLRIEFREAFGEPVGPAADAGPVVAVADAFGVTVAQGDVAEVGCAAHAWALRSASMQTNIVLIDK